MDPDERVVSDTRFADSSRRAESTPPREKYIRTYAGDMATVQKGGIPDLTPLVEAPVSPPDRGEPRVQASPVSISTLTMPAFTPPPLVPAGPPPVPPPPPPPPPPQVEPPPLPVEAPPPTPLHTYGGDFSERIAQTGASTATILAAQLDARRLTVPAGARESTAPPAKPRGNWLKIVAGGVLLLIGGGGTYFAYTRYIATGPVVLAPTVFSPIFVDERETVSGKGTPLLLALSQAVGRPLPDAQMRLVYDPNATTSDASIFNELKLPVQDILLRNIDAAGSMAGVVDIAGVQSPFFILSVTSYGDTFASMLTWEPAMLRNLSLLFPAYPPAMVANAVASTSSAASTTPPAPALVNSVTPPPRDQGFIDEVVANHDTRVYRDGEGRSVLIYGYWNQRTLVIARDEAAFTAILGRLATSRTR